MFWSQGDVLWLRVDPKTDFGPINAEKQYVFWMYEVASILIHSGLRQKRISWGGEITPLPPVEISCFRGQYK